MIMSVLLTLTRLYGKLTVSAVWITVNLAGMATIRKLRCVAFGDSRRLTFSSSTRWQAQIDAVSVIHSAKMRAHPQSAVGLMSMGGNGPEVLSTFTSDFGKILSGLHRTKIHGSPHLASSIQVAGVSVCQFSGYVSFALTVC